MVHPLSMAFHGYPDRRDAWLGSAASAEGMAEPIWHSSRGVSSVRREGVPRALGELLGRADGEDLVDFVEIEGWRRTGGFLWSHI